MLKLLVNPGEQASEPCRLSLSPARSYLVLNSHHSNRGQKEKTGAWTSTGQWAKMCFMSPAKWLLMIAVQGKR